MTCEAVTQGMQSRSGRRWCAGQFTLTNDTGAAMVLPPGHLSCPSSVWYQPMPVVCTGLAGSIAVQSRICRWQCLQLVITP